MRRELMVLTVAGDERDPHVAELPDRDGGGWVAEWSGDCVFLHIVEERVEAGPAEHADVGVRHAVLASVELLVGASFLVSDFVSDFESDFDSDFESDFESDFSDEDDSDFVSDDLLSDDFAAVLFERLSVL
jgi:hypothetical protein